MDFSRPEFLGVSVMRSFKDLVPCAQFFRPYLIACGRISITVSSDSTAPVASRKIQHRRRPQTPHRPRLKGANGVFLAFAAHAFRDTVEHSPQTERVASGVCITRGNSRASGSDYETGFPGKLTIDF